MSKQPIRSSLANFLVQLWPLPRPSNRQLSRFLPFPKHVKQCIRLDRDGDYLCYQAAIVTQAVCLFFLAVLLLDAAAELGWFVNPVELAKRKAHFIDVYMVPVTKFTPLVVIAFYARIRLPLDIQHDQIPIFMAKKSLRGRSRKDFIQINAFLIAVMLLGVAFAGIHTKGLLEMYNLEDDMSACAALLAGLVFVIPIFVSLIISMMLLLEKSIRFFPQAQEDLDNW